MFIDEVDETMILNQFFFRMNASRSIHVPDYQVIRHGRFVDAAGIYGGLAVICRVPQLF